MALESKIKSHYLKPVYSSYCEFVYFLTKCSYLARSVHITAKLLDHHKCQGAKCKGQIYFRSVLRLLTWSSFIFEHVKTNTTIAFSVYMTSKVSDRRHGIKRQGQSYINLSQCS